jgi:hypothetical protein
MGGNILKRHGIPPALKRKNTTKWKEFLCQERAPMVTARSSAVNGTVSS